MTSVTPLSSSAFDAVDGVGIDRDDVDLERAGLACFLADTA